MKKMKKRIKFRVWDKCKRKYWSFNKIDAKYDWLVDEQDPIGKDFIIIEKNTRICDSCGNEIYENDFVDITDVGLCVMRKNQKTNTWSFVLSIKNKPDRWFSVEDVKDKNKRKVGDIHMNDFYQTKPVARCVGGYHLRKDYIEREIDHILSGLMEHENVSVSRKFLKKIKTKLMRLNAIKHQSSRITRL